jgi:hypothetical protein
VGGDRPGAALAGDAEFLDLVGAVSVLPGPSSTQTLPGAGTATTWEQEALQQLPLIIAGGTPPRYAAQGGIDAFNARASQAGGACP